MKESMQNQQNRQRWMLVSSLVIMAILFIILALADAFGLLRSTDLKITNFIELFKSPLLTKVADFLSWFGETPQGYLILVLSVIVLI
jgi:hypothetical protein